MLLLQNESEANSACICDDSRRFTQIEEHDVPPRYEDWLGRLECSSVTASSHRNSFFIDKVNRLLERTDTERAEDPLTRMREKLAGKNLTFDFRPVSTKEVDPMTNEIVLILRTRWHIILDHSAGIENYRASASDRHQSMPRRGHLPGGV